MADPFSTFIGHLANLISFKSSLRLLIIAGSIIACWVYIRPELVPLKIPSELLVSVVVAIGFSIGALISSVIYYISDQITSAIKKLILKRREKKKELEDKENLEILNDEKNRLLINSFDEYSYSAKEILLKLLYKDCAIRIEDSNVSHFNVAFMGLLEGKIILILNRIDKKTSFCTINPIYKESLLRIYNDKHQHEVNELFSINPEGLDKLISLFKETSHSEDKLFTIDDSVYSNRYRYTPAIKFEAYSDDEFGEDCDIQFYIDDHHFPFIVEKCGPKLRGYILCQHIAD
ncbi:hypothetical protein IFR07_16510 [Pantoea agglomerans]|uniref:hypothetical protein n=1 Tax=Enterobacter agglomerans TaxID=549 RepID=UPI0017824ACF|nr:hypothetical protein [Pantoea agglomerans]MBD8118497.1 hypothetical protein [Pantoea agglomerans]